MRCWTAATPTPALDHRQRPRRRSIADNYAVEAHPAVSHPGCCAALPLHEHCLFKLGVHLGEMWHLSPLADWLRRARPLPLPPDRTASAPAGCRRLARDPDRRRSDPRAPMPLHASPHQRHPEGLRASCALWAGMRPCGSGDHGCDGAQQGDGAAHPGHADRGRLRPRVSRPGRLCARAESLAMAAAAATARSARPRAARSDPARGCVRGHGPALGPQRRRGRLHRPGDRRLPDPGQLSGFRQPAAAWASAPAR